ncbi:MAG: ribbon-helix-helix domain-containing protein [Candidatus Nanoarchaeia archaeon]
MVMDTIQIRLNPGLITKIDLLVDEGIYANRGDVIRDAVRRFVWEQEVGSIKGKGDSVKQISTLRKKLSKKKINLTQINKL